MIPTTTAPVATPEQLIGVLDKELFMECTRLQAAELLYTRLMLYAAWNPLGPVPPEVLTSCGDYLRFLFRFETDRLLDSRL